VKTYLVGGMAILLILAGVWFVTKRRSISTGAVGQGSLFVTVDSGTGARLLDDWRWMIGDDPQVVEATVFGDVFTEDAEGRVYWLDTGRGQYVEVAKNRGEWRAALKRGNEQWFHWDTLQHLRSLGVELQKGDVYSWRHAPMVGGAEVADNVDVVSLEVHVSFAGRLAQSLEDLPAGAPIQDVEFEVLGPGGVTGSDAADGEDLSTYVVVINGELQYSMWPAGEKIPAGWESVGKTGSKEECLDYIAEVWTDMRPLSLREAARKEGQ